ncbi:MAG TPA: tetratricopeptide repeat protein, partial [Pyrinomonadaceae bacterium]
MPTICSRFFLRLAVSSLAACVVGIPPAIGQTQTNGQTRPRSLATYQDPSIGNADEPNLVAGSPEARAEAKKLYKAGVGYGNGGFFPQAAELFRRALRLDPQYVDAHYGLGRAYSDMREWDKAVESFEHVVALDPKDKDAQKRLTHARLMLDTEKRESEETNRTQASVPTGAKETVSANDLALTKLYRVGPGDVLDISFDPTKSAQFTVSSSGFLNHPSLSEPLLVAGLTVEDISAKLEGSAKRAGVVSNGSFSVAVGDYVSHTILVSGLVKDPGTKILRREGIPLSVVLADAQPLPEAGRAAIARSESNETFTIDLVETPDVNFIVRPGDVITLKVNPPQFFYVAGRVKEPGEKAYRRGLTLTQAIIIAGGVVGKSGEVRLARDDGKGFLIVSRYKLQDIESGSAKDPLIQAGDR